MATSTLTYADKFKIINSRSERYSDFYTNLDKNFGTKDLARLTDDDSVIQSIKNIIFTKKGERPFFPQFGCNVSSLLFENYNEFTFEAIKTEIRTAIENFEPRAKVDKIVIQESEQEHGVSAFIYFNTINTPEPIVLSFLLSRIR